MIQLVTRGFSSRFEIRFKLKNNLCSWSLKSLIWPLYGSDGKFSFLFCRFPYIAHFSVLIVFKMLICAECFPLSISNFIGWSSVSFQDTDMQMLRELIINISTTSLRQPYTDCIKKKHFIQFNNNYEMIFIGTFLTKNGKNQHIWTQKILKLRIKKKTHKVTNFLWWKSVINGLKTVSVA